MATKLDKLKWQLYQTKSKVLLAYGIKNGLIKFYDEEFIERLRHVYYGGVAGSILLLSTYTCNRHCYDRALLATFGMGDDDFKLVDADIDGITLNPILKDKYANHDEHYGNHCFVERTDKNGIVWVYDTTDGLVYEKNLYYKMERPKITQINDKQATLDYIEYKDIKNANIEHDKYGLPIILPNIEKSVDRCLYKDRLRQEIEMFKQEINYDGICKEIHDDMVRLGMRR